MASNSVNNSELICVEWANKPRYDGTSALVSLNCIKTVNGKPAEDSDNLRVCHGDYLTMEFTYKRGRMMRIWHGLVRDNKGEVDLAKLSHQTLPDSEKTDEIEQKGLL